MEERKVISLLAPGVDEEEMAKKADLVDGKVPASQLPSYVDDVVEYENVEAFPEDGEQGKIYVALDSGFTYRWSGSEYIQIGGQDLSDYYTKEEADQLLDTKQPVGDYATNSALEAGLATKQPVGDYATNTALAEGLADKQDVGDYATSAELTAGLATKQDVGDYATNADLALKANISDVEAALANKADVDDGFPMLQLDDNNARTNCEFDMAGRQLIQSYLSKQPGGLRPIPMLRFHHRYYGFGLAVFDNYHSSNGDGYLNVFFVIPTRNNPAQTTSGLWTVAAKLQYDTNQMPYSSAPYYDTRAEALLAFVDANKSIQWDTTPTANSTKPVTSGGIYTALAAKQDAGDYATSVDLEALEQAVATDMEVVPYQNQTPLTVEQLAKAERGELAILNNNLVHTKFTQDGNVVSFQALEHMAAVGTYTPGYNVRMRRYTITLDRATRMLNDGAGYQQGISISDTDANFLASGETPAADGKRVIREMNMPGTLSDAELELAWTMPNKGDIIRFDAFGDGTQKRFRVVKLEDAVATIMSMDDDITSLYNDTYTTTTFDDTYTGLQYANSLIDVACNTTYYNQLSSETKAAIITTNRVQDYWNGSASGSDTIFRIDSRDSFTRFGQPHAHTIIGDRYCFVLGMDDLVEYFNIQQGDRVSGLDFVEFYTEQTAIKYDTYFRLSTVYYGKSVYSLTVYDAIIHNYNYDLLPTSIVRPAFRIDLSKIQFTRE